MGDASAHRDSVDQDIIYLEDGWGNSIKKLALDPLEVVYLWKISSWCENKILNRTGDSWWRLQR